MSLRDRFKKIFRPTGISDFEIKDWDSLAYLKKNYQIEKLLFKIEQTPLYYEGEALFRQVDEAERDNVLKAIKDKYEVALENIEQVFNPVLEDMYQDLLQEKEPYLSHHIQEEITKVEKIIEDFRVRADLWRRAANTVACLGSKNFHGKRLYREQCKVLENLEETYAPYNEGRGLEVLQKAKERFCWSEKEKPGNGVKVEQNKIKVESGISR